MPYLPLTKTDLDAIAAASNIGADKVGEVNRQRAIGRWFQGLCLRSLNLTENGRQFPTMARDLGTGSNRGFVTPDAVTSPEYWRSGSSSAFERGLERLAFYIFDAGAKTLPDSTFYEFKALKEGTVINLADSETQIKGMIDAASQTAATKDSQSPTPSTVNFITTDSVTLGFEVTAYATAKDVLLVQHVAEQFQDEQGTSKGLRVNAGNALNSVVVTRRGAVLQTLAGRLVSFSGNLTRINLLPPVIRVPR